MNAPIRTEIFEGARYFDDPLYDVHSPRAEVVSPVAMGIAAAFKGKVPTPISELVGYQKVRLRWMTPDGKGGLVPRGQRKK